MKPKKSWHMVAAMVCLVLALLTTFNGFKLVMSGNRIPAGEEQRQGYLLALIIVPLMFYLAAAVLYSIGVVRRRKDSK